MQIRELIEKLQEIYERRGNVEVESRNSSGDLGYAAIQDGDAVPRRNHLDKSYMVVILDGE